MGAEREHPEPPKYRYPIFEVEVCLTEQDIDRAGGDLAQAAQNAIGHTGARIVEVVSDA